MSPLDDNRKTILIRAYLVYVMVLLFGVAIIVRIAVLQWGQGGYWKKKAEELVVKYENIEAKRGNIYSDDESLLATSVDVYDIGMDVNPKVVPDSIFNRDLDSLCIKMGSLFKTPKSFFYNKLHTARQKFVQDSLGYVFLKKNISYSQLKKVQKFPIFKRGRFKGGLVINAKEVRERPYKSLARRTIGYVKLAQYDVKIDLSKGRIPADVYAKYADTLALCMYNLFHDGYSKQHYRNQLDKSYREHKIIAKRADSRQLKRLQDFPLFEGMTEETGFKTKKVAEEYLIGLEGAYNELLSGRDGTRVMKKMGAGTFKEVTDANLLEPVNGYDIYTSIDINLQDVAENALQKCLDSNQAQWGCVILMEVKTGLLKAIVNLAKDSSGRYYEARNYAIGEQIEPGSTFKLASVIATLEEGVFDSSSRVPTGTGVIGNRFIEDAYPPGYGQVSLSKALEKSSNLGISYATYNTFSKKIDKFKDYLDKMGLTIPLGIEIAGEPAPSMPIKYGDMETIPYGYVVKMTPLQILSLYNSVANNGIMVKPRLVKAVGRAGKIVYRTQVKVLRKSICTQATLDKVKKMLEGVVRHGTASNINNSVYKIAGKTGTARIYEHGAYIMKYVASFVGYFPADNPQYSCIVVVHRASGSEYSGSQISAPVFKEIADKVFATRLDIKAIEQNKSMVMLPPPACVARQQDLVSVYTNVNFNRITGGALNDWTSVDNQGTSVILKPKYFPDNQIPDVHGMGARDAVFLLESRGLKVFVNGKGSVVGQSLAPGKPLVKGSKITLTLGL
jgi:cell division protein FtsI (penicillin-binding protein 3)